MDVRTALILSDKIGIILRALWRTSTYTISSVERTCYPIILFQD